jgi:hypothetical protein
LPNIALNGIDAINRIAGEWTMARLPQALQQLDRGLAIDASLSPDAWRTRSLDAAGAVCRAPATYQDNGSNR